VPIAGFRPHRRPSGRQRLHSRCCRW
jgi:hypothetical protein